MSSHWNGAGLRPQVPFRRLYTPVKRPVTPGAAIVTAYTDGQVTLRSNRDKLGYHEAADLSGYQGVQPGDLVVHGLDILRGSVGVSDSAGAMSSVCTVCLPSERADGRFVAYAIRAQANSGFTRVLARGIREGGADFRRWDTLGDLPIPLPLLAEQRQIADYLDYQLGIVDRIAEVRARQKQLLEEHRRAQLTDMFFAPGLAQRKVGHLAELSHGRQRSPDHESGPFMTTYLRSANVQDGRLDLTDVKQMNFTPEERRRYGLRVGDVLVTEASGSAESIGAAAQWNGELAGSVCFQNHVVRLRSLNSAVLPDYLYWWARASYASGAMRVWATGANILNLGSASLSQMPVPVRDIREQQQLVGQLAAHELTHRGMREALRESLIQLAELKAGLIGAAVSGDFDVSAASGRGFPE